MKPNQLKKNPFKINNLFFSVLTYLELTLAPLSAGRAILIKKQPGKMKEEKKKNYSLYIYITVFKRISTQLIKKRSQN